MAGSTTLRFKCRLEVSPAEAYRAFTHPTLWRDWLAEAAQAESLKGGRLYLWWNGGYFAVGEFLTLDKPNKVAFTWFGQGYPAPTRVQVAFAPQGQGASVTLTHSGFGAGKAWAAVKENARRGWEVGLENLVSVLDQGVDLRVARLPRLGVYIDDFTHEAATRLGVPVKEGVLLGGAVEGLGAHQAGLQKDDVLVKFAGKRLTGWPALAEALRGKQGGDKVKVEFYRGADKRTVTMELGKREVPPLPESAQALAENARRNYTALDAELEQALEGVTEAQAEHRPAPDEWNVKELVAHYIAMERDLQSWVAGMLHDNEIGDSLEYRPNATVRLQGLVRRFRSLEGLLDELHQSQAETLDLLGALPAEFVARKPLWRRVASWMNDYVPGHFREEHAGQLKAALAAGKQS